MDDDKPAGPRAWSFGRAAVLLVLLAGVTWMLRRNREQVGVQSPAGLAPPEWGGTPQVIAARAPAEGPPHAVRGPGRALFPADAGVLDAGADGGLALETVTTMFEISAALHRNAEEAAASVERYCAETAKLPKNVLATPPTVDPNDPGSQLHDAAYFLTPLIDWFGQPGQAGTPGQLHLPPGLHDRIAAAGADWPTALTLADTDGLDFDWITALSAFDHWSLATAGATAENAATVDPPNLPIPDYRMLIDYVKLRLVRALATGEGSAALAEVKHLADLVHSNGIVIGDSAATRMLEAESAFAALARQRGATGLDWVTPFDSSTGDTFRQLELAGMAFTFPGVDAAVAKQALSCMPDRCTALGEGISMRRELDSFTDTAESGESFALANGSSCDRTLFALFETAPLSSGAGNPAGGSEPLPLERLFPDLKRK